MADTVLLNNATVTKLVSNDADTLVLKTGVQGPAGAGDLDYTHTQGSPSATWTIAHSLGKIPSITIVDSAGNEVEGAIEHTSINSATATFSAAFSGKAYCN